LKSPVLVFDAAGLALFAVSGAQKALAFGLNPVIAALLGMLTGVGGGMVRDVLVAEIPTVLRGDIYAVAALAGAAVVVIGQLLHIPPTATTIVGALLCFCASWPFTVISTCRSQGRLNVQPAKEPRTINHRPTITTLIALYSQLASQRSRHGRVHHDKI
jgi:hypothetical protein